MFKVSNNAAKIDKNIGITNILYRNRFHKMPNPDMMGSYSL